MILYPRIPKAKKLAITGLLLSAIPLCSQSGIFYTPAEVETWQDRSQNGPYKSKGDAYDPLIPGEWERIVTQKVVFMDNPTLDRKKTIVLNSGGNDAVIHNHRDLLSAAFFSLVKEDAVVAETVVKELVWQAMNGPEIDPDTYLRTDQGAWWVSAWFHRLAVACDFVRKAFTEEEFQIVKDWLSDWAHMDQASIHQEITGTSGSTTIGLFPDRADRSYIPYPKGHVNYKSRVDLDLYDPNDPFSSDPALGFVRDDPTNEQHAEFAYQDADGQLHNPIYNVHRVYNNRKAVRVQNFAVIGALIDSDFLLDRARLYVEEWLKFSVFPDGSTGEYERNEFTRSVQQGYAYNAHNLVTAVLVADILARRGDNSLYEYSTREGIFGTECPESGSPKSIKMAVMTQLDLIDGRKQWFIDVGDPKNLMHRIDPTSELDSNQRVADQPKQWISDITYAPMGNAYWKDERIRDVYTRSSVGSEGYCKAGCLNVQSPGPYWDPKYAYGPWQGMNYCSPSVLFISGEMESVVEYPRQGPLLQLKQSIPDGVQHLSYATSFHAAAGTPPYRWEISGGRLPEGISLSSSTGRMNGYPESLGVHDFSVKITDGSGSSSELEYQLTVHETIPEGILASYSFENSDNLGFDGAGGYQATSVGLTGNSIGRINHGISFDKESGQVMHVPALPLQDQITISIWLNIHDIDGFGYQHIFSLGDNGETGPDIQLYIIESRNRLESNPSHLVTFVKGETNQSPLPNRLKAKSLDLVTFAQEDGWNHYALAISSEEIAVYWNGQPVSVINNLDLRHLDLGQMMQFSGPSRFGESGYVNHLDEILIFDRFLNVTEVDRVRRSGTSRGPWGGNIGWNNIDNLGWLNDALFPWVYSLELDWIYCLPDWAAAFWFMAGDGYWYWTSSQIYPFGYAYNSSSWVVLPAS